LWQMCVTEQDISLPEYDREYRDTALRPGGSRRSHRGCRRPRRVDRADRGSLPGSRTRPPRTARSARLSWPGDGRGHLYSRVRPLNRLRSAEYDEAQHEPADQHEHGSDGYAVPMQSLAHVVRPEMEREWYEDAEDDDEQQEHDAAPAQPHARDAAEREEEEREHDELQNERPAVEPGQELDGRCMCSGFATSECEEGQGRGSRRGGGGKEQEAGDVPYCPDRPVGHGQQHTRVARDKKAKGRAHEGEHLAERAVEEHAQASPADASLVCERADRRGSRNPAKEEERPGADRHW